MTTSPLVPGLLPVAIDDHPYLCDPDYERATVQVIRQQADQSFEPGEQSLTPLGLWRRSQESWHHGAGQPFLDGRTGLSAYSQINADPERFRASKGTDPWTHGQISLLHPTLRSWASANSNLYMALAQEPGGPSFLAYVADGTEVYQSANPFNLLSGNGEQDGTGWTPTNATVGAQSYYFRLTGTAAAAISATSAIGTGGMAVDPSRGYLASIHSIYSGGGSARTPSFFVNWYTAAGAFVSSSATFTAGGTDAGGVSAVSTTITSPATAAFASITITYSGGAIGELHDVDSATLAPVNVVASNFATEWQSIGINAGEAAQTVQSLTSNGRYVWAALGSSGIHRALATLSAPSTTANKPGPGAGWFTLVAWANGRLLAAGSDTDTTHKNVLFEITDPLGTPVAAPIFTHADTSFVWSFISPGRNCIYAGGNSGGNAEVYRITLEDVSTALGAPTHCTYLPDGETIHSLQFYAGGIVMGTGKGVRLGQADGQGNIDYGPLIATQWPVRCLEPQDRYCWFGWTKYDATSSGLGRVDLGFFTDTLTPAWSSDLMAVGTTQADVVAVITMAPYSYTVNQIAPVRMFSVAGKGVYIEDIGSRVASGTFQTGTIRFGTTEPKLTRSLDLRHHALPAGATVAVEMQRNQSGIWEALGTSSTTDSTGPTAPYDALSEQAESLEFRYTIARSTAYTSPELTRWTAKVLPLPSTIDETFTLNLHMKTTIETTAGDGQPRHMDVAAEIAYLKGLEQTRTPVTLQLGSDSFDVYVVQSSFKGTNWSSPLREFAEGVLQLQCQTMRG